MAAPAISSVIGRWMLAAMLALMPSVCRCHTALHQHMHDAPVGATHDELAGTASGHGHHHHHHHHGSNHHDHTAAPELGDGPAVLAWMISDHHHHHETCQCPPMRSCVAQYADDQQRDPGVMVNIATRRSTGLDTPNVREVLTRWDRVPQPPRALLHLHCVLLI